MGLEWHSGQLWLRIDGAAYLCGNEGKCWNNWTNADLPDPEGRHSVITISPDCKTMYEDIYRGGETDPDPSLFDSYDFAGR